MIGDYKNLSWQRVDENYGAICHVETGEEVALRICYIENSSFILKVFEFLCQKGGDLIMG